MLIIIIFYYCKHIINLIYDYHQEMVMANLHNLDSAGKNPNSNQFHNSFWK